MVTDTDAIVGAQHALEESGSLRIPDQINIRVVNNNNSLISIIPIIVNFGYWINKCCCTTIGATILYYFNARFHLDFNGDKILFFSSLFVIIFIIRFKNPFKFFSKISQKISSNQNMF